MNRLDAMLERLPPIWRIEEGAVTHQMLQLVAAMLTVFDEDMDRVQRSHWIDTAFDRVDLEKIGALFDIDAAAWEPDRLYRERLKATIAARLRGAVTRSDLEFVIVRILAAALQALGLRLFRMPPNVAPGKTVFCTGSTDNALSPAFVEFPKVRKRCPSLVKRAGLLKPLDFITITNNGLHPTPLEGVIRGMSGNRTAVPVLANLTNGTLIGFAGRLRCGKELHFSVNDDGTLRGFIDGQDVSDRLFTTDEFQAGEDYKPVVPAEKPVPIVLERGANKLWFISMLLYDVSGLDAAMIQIPSPNLRQGVFTASENEDKTEPSSEGSCFDQSLFHQPPAAVVDLWWDEDKPAAFRFELPVGAVRHDIEQNTAPDLNLKRLIALLEQTVDALRAAGVDGGMSTRPLRETQTAYDRVTVLRPDQGQETSPQKDVLAALSAIFDFTAKDGSRFG